LAVDAVPEHQPGDVRQEVNVQWKRKSYTMFLVDLQERVEPPRLRRRSDGNNLRRYSDAAAPGSLRASTNAINAAAKSECDRSRR
jgi:hypothetical protein